MKAFSITRHQRIRLTMAAFSLLFSAALPNKASLAADETKSLELLVTSLDVVDDSERQEALLRGMLAGLAGRRNVAPPDAWQQVSKKLSQSDSSDVRELASQLAQIFGDESATKRALRMVGNKEADTAARRRALHSLLTQRDQRVSDSLESLLAEPGLRMDAIRGYAAIAVAEAPAVLLKRYAKADSQERKAILETLATRPAYAKELLNALKTGQVAREEVPAHVARSLQFLLGEEFTRAYGEVRELGQDRAALISKYKKLLTEEALDSANLVAGRAIYKKTCASCHVLYDSGGKIGPDLTGSNRANLDYILLNSVDPSYDVPDSYKMVIVQTDDGRVLNGVVAEEDNQRLVLKTVEQPRVVLLKSDIARQRVSEKSMMPEGQLEKLKPQEVINLIAYLQTIEQVEEAP